MNGFPGPIMLGFHETIFKFSSPRDVLMMSLCGKSVRRDLYQNRVVTNPILKEIFIQIREQNPTLDFSGFFGKYSFGIITVGFCLKISYAARMTGLIKPEFNLQKTPHFALENTRLGTNLKVPHLGKPINLFRNESSEQTVIRIACGISPDSAAPSLYFSKEDIEAFEKLTGLNPRSLIDRGFFTRIPNLGREVFLIGEVHHIHEEDQKATVHLRAAAIKNKNFILFDEAGPPFKARTPADHVMGLIDVEYLFYLKAFYNKMRITIAIKECNVDVPLLSSTLLNIYTDVALFPESLVARWKEVLRELPKEELAAVWLTDHMKAQTPIEEFLKAKNKLLEKPPAFLPFSILNIVSTIVNVMHEPLVSKGLLGPEERAPFEQISKEPSTKALSEFWGLTFGTQMSKFFYANIQTYLKGFPTSDKPLVIKTGAAHSADLRKLFLGQPLLPYRHWY